MAEGKGDFGFSGRVLVVDDDPVNRRALEALLGRLGLTVVTAAEGREALGKFSEAPCDLVFLDLNMPVMDGFQTAEEIRRHEETETRVRVPVIAVSGDLGQQLSEKCRAAGMDDCLTKPFTLEKLLDMLKKWLSGPKHPPPRATIEPE